MIVEFAIFGCLALAALGASGRVQELLGAPAGLILAGCGVIMAAAAIVSLGEELAHTYLHNRKEWNIGSAAGELALISARSVFLRQVSALTIEQLAFVGRVRASIVLEPGSIAPAKYLMIGTKGELFLLQDVRAFLADCGPAYLCPVGHYSENTDLRKTAQAVTEFMIENKYAEPAAGNKPARWLLREAGLRAIGEWRE